MIFGIVWWTSLQGVYKLLRGDMQYNPSLTLPQFFSHGFAEHKMILVTDLIKLVKEKKKEITKAVGAKKKKA